MPFYSSSASNNRRCRRCRALLLPGIASEACHQCQGPGSSLRDADLISVWSQHLFWLVFDFLHVGDVHPDREHPSVPVLLDQRYLKKLSFKRLLAPASHMSIPCAEPAFMPPLGGHTVIFAEWCLCVRQAVWVRPFRSVFCFLSKKDF